MITCPNCAHANPDAAVECEACYTPLPAMISCPNCGATVSAAAHFCGQCGHDLQQAQSPAQASAPSVQPLAPTVIGAGAETSMPQPPIAPPSVALPPDVPPALAGTSMSEGTLSGEAVSSQAVPAPPAPVAQPAPAAQPEADSPQSPDGPAVASGEAGSGYVATPESTQSSSPAAASRTSNGSTQLQQTAARLFHIQSNNVIELPLHLSVIHIGKPNGQIPPDIDLSGVADSDIVSRVHADIRVEGDTFYLEDLGSSNGTYVNNLLLQMGDRHRLRPGDRIAFGKGDKVSFLFQFS
jgi:pSer/pThr/pTyr-binding forkhead associated (FHA) protein